MGFAFIWGGGEWPSMFQTVTTSPDQFGEGMENLHIPLGPAGTLQSRILPQSLESA